MLRPQRVIVCGGRDWTDADLVRYWLDRILERGTPLMLKHGGCPSGVDAIAHSWAARDDRKNWGCYGVRVKVYPADWNKHGKRAGPLRNQQMADDGADECLAFWGGSSRGTLDMITRATKAGIPVRIVPKEKRP